MGERSRPPLGERPGRATVAPSAVRDAASVLREGILHDLRDHEDEWLLGAEDDVMQELGVSRSTLRQALRVLEQEQLVRVRRGVGGGLFARRPTESGVSHTASVYLRAEGTTYGDLMGSLILLATHSARQAAENPDVGRRAALLTFYEDRSPGDPAELSSEAFVELAGGFVVAITELTGSPTLRMFVTVLIELARPAAGSTLYTPERIAATLQGHRSVAEAIAAGDPDAAARRLTRHYQAALAWTDEGVPLDELYPGPSTLARIEYTQ